MRWVFHSCIRWPSFVIFALAKSEATLKVSGEIARLLAVMKGEMKRQDFQNASHLRQKDHLRMAYLLPALEAGLIEMTIPEEPENSKQKYRLTEKGIRFLAEVKEAYSRPTQRPT